jgi:hypothetical protein
LHKPTWTIPSTFTPLNGNEIWARVDDIYRIKELNDYGNNAMGTNYPMSREIAPPADAPFKLFARPPSIFTRDTLRCTDTSMLAIGWDMVDISVKDPKLDPNSIMYRIQAVQTNPEKKWTADSLKNNIVTLKSLSFYDSLQSGLVSFTAEAFDAKGYSTGWGNAVKLIFGAPVTMIEEWRHESAAAPAAYRLFLLGNNVVLHVPGGSGVRTRGIIELFDTAGRRCGSYQVPDTQQGICTIAIPDIVRAHGNFIMRFRNSRWQTSIEVPQL